MEAWRSTVCNAIEAWNDDDDDMDDAWSRAYVKRDYAAAHTRIYNDYFGVNPVYGSDKFRRRFRMARPLFERIMEGVSEQDSFICENIDATGQAGLSPLQKCVAAIRMLCYDIPADALDEYVRIGESTAMLSF
ncbi:hypothetical protein AaE_008570 [Aphanomyces astaci]|uniref:Uncharacterized protein n=1 Tax=Aphanomyces astaci TaxID=112090 RepID=A0A6A5AEN2_APHAT|nr:hypothetical protein AaE_008570 [Aphanomyces astaci]